MSVSRAREVCHRAPLALTGALASRTGSRFARALVVAQLALSVLLFAGAGLLMRSFVTLTGEEPGFEPDGLLAAAVDLPRYRYAELETRTRFFETLLERLEAEPGVEGVAAVGELPFSRLWYKSSFSIDGRGPYGEYRTGEAGFRVATPGYFRTMGVPLLRGRDFADTDRSDRRAVAIVNQAFVDRYFPQSDGLGRRVAIHLTGANSWATIVGIVGNVKHLRLGERPEPEVYRPLVQEPLRAMTVVLRGADDPGDLVPRVRAAVHQVDSQQPLAWVRTLDDLVGDSVAEPRFYTTLLSAFAALAVLLAAVGLYSILTYLVKLRTHELGIRMTLGAKPEAVRRLVVRHGLLLTMPGLALGLLGAFALSRVLQNLLYQVGPHDPVTFAGISVILLGVALLASFVAARRAAKVDPVQPLKVV